MDTFKVSQWFKKRSALNIQLIEVSGVEFEIMALSDEQKEAVLDCETHDQALAKSANYGISYDRKRVSDDKELAKDIDMLWELEEVNTESDPCMQFLIGEKVCEISGIQSEIDGMLVAEKLEEERKLQAELESNSVDGDKLDELPTDVSMAELEQDAVNYNLHQ